MAMLKISLPDEMKTFIEREAIRKGFGNASEYVHSVLLAVQEQERSRGAVRAKLLEAVESGPATPMTRSDWDEIKREVERRHAARQEDGHGGEDTQGR